MFSNISKYHEALMNLFKSVFKGNVILEPVDTAFDYAIKQSKGKLSFPFISIYPTPTITLEHRNNNFASYKEGLKLYKEVPVYDNYGNLVDSTGKISKNVKTLYINIEYQIDVWALDRSTVEEVMQELVFWLYENQEVSTEYQGQKLKFTFSIGDSIQDNTDLTSYEANNKLYRNTINIMVSATLMRSENYFNVIEPIVYVNIKKEE